MGSSENDLCSSAKPLSLAWQLFCGWPWPAVIRGCQSIYALLAASWASVVFALWSCPDGLGLFVCAAEQQEVVL